MPRTGYGVYLPAISLERSLPVPLYQQLCGGIRRAILQGSLTRGLRLPSTRCLASELRVSRNIVVMAFEQLLAEGYVEATTGAGTFVTNTLPDDVLQVDTRLPNEETRLPPQGRKVKQLPKLTLASSDPKLLVIAGMLRQKLRSTVNPQAFGGCAMQSSLMSELREGCAARLTK